MTASPLGTPRDAAGVLGDPRTSVLFGGRDINDDFRSGVRFYAGTWLDECQTCGIDTSTFYLEPGNDSGGVHLLHERNDLRPAVPRRESG